MKKYYVVSTKIRDDGSVSCCLLDVIEAEAKPANTFSSTPRYDLYVDYFESREEADKFIEESRNA